MAPPATMSNPVGKNSKRPKGWSEARERVVLTRMLAVVRRVNVPPIRAPKASGIRSRDGCRCVCRAMATADGRSTAAAAMLFMNIESTAAVSIRAVARRASLAPRPRSRRIPTQCVTPVFSSAKVRMKMARIVMTADWLKPAKACSGVTIPVRLRTMRMRRAVRSGRSRSVTRSKAATPTSASVTQPAGSMRAALYSAHLGVSPLRASAGDTTRMNPTTTWLDIDLMRSNGTPPARAIDAGGGDGRRQAGAYGHGAMAARAALAARPGRRRAWKKD
jgi:hypothetical protein